MDDGGAVTPAGVEIGTNVDEGGAVAPAGVEIGTNVDDLRSAPT